MQERHTIMAKFNYDKQIARLTADPAKIVDDWGDGIGLFEYLGTPFIDVGPTKCIGCPTMVKNIKPYGGSRERVAETPEVTAFVRNHPDIPCDSSNIGVEHLQAFKEVQEFADARLPSRQVKE